MAIIAFAPTGYGVLKPREMFSNISIIEPTGIIVERDDEIHIDGTELYSLLLYSNVQRGATQIHCEVQVYMTILII
jgi:hypothetical protein